MTAKKSFFRRFISFTLVLVLLMGIFPGLGPASANAETGSDPEPTVEPTAEPSVEPTVEPTAEPSVEPTVEPTVEPGVEPTDEPEHEHSWLYSAEGNSLSAYCADESCAVSFSISIIAEDRVFTEQPVEQDGQTIAIALPYSGAQIDPAALAAFNEATGNSLSAEDFVYYFVPVEGEPVLTEKEAHGAAEQGKAPSYPGSYALRLCLEGIYCEARFQIKPADSKVSSSDVHNWVYSAAGNVLTASCSDADCTESCSIVLNPADTDYARNLDPINFYDGIKLEEESLNSFNQLTGSSISDADLVFCLLQGEEELLTTAKNSGATTEGGVPMFYGKYRVKLSHGGVTAAADFEIKKPYTSFIEVKVGDEAPRFFFDWDMTHGTGWSYAYDAAADGTPVLVRLRYPWHAERTDFSYEMDGKNGYSHDRLLIDGNRNITLDLYGQELSRNLENYGCTDRGQVLVLKDNAVLTIIDSSESGTGKITGGRNDNRYGGAISMEDKASLIIKGGSISGNQNIAQYPDKWEEFRYVSYGGAIYAQENCSIIMSGGSISNNKCNSAGGAIYLTDNCSLTVTGGSFIGNSARYKGGAIYANENTSVSISNAVFTDNVSYDDEGYYTSNMGDGGAISVTGDVSASIIGCTFSRNNAKRSGGAIYADSKTNLFVSGCSVTGNTATRTGGIEWNSSGKFHLINSTISGNRGTEYGGGVTVNETDPYIGGLLQIYDNYCGENPENLFLPNWMFDAEEQLNHAVRDGNFYPLEDGSRIGLSFGESYNYKDIYPFSAKGSRFYIDSYKHFFSDDPNFYIRRVYNETAGDPAGANKYQLYITRHGSRDDLDAEIISAEVNPPMDCSSPAAVDSEKRSLILTVDNEYKLRAGKISLDRLAEIVFTDDSRIIDSELTRDFVETPVDNYMVIAPNGSFSCWDISVLPEGGDWVSHKLRLENDGVTVMEEDRFHEDFVSLDLSSYSSTAFVAELADYSSLSANFNNGILEFEMPQTDVSIIMEDSLLRKDSDLADVESFEELYIHRDQLADYEKLLPATVKLTTVDGQEYDAEIIWDGIPEDFDPEDSSAKGLDILGSPVLPKEVTNPSNILPRLKFSFKFIESAPRCMSVTLGEETTLYTEANGGFEAGWAAAYAAAQAGESALVVLHSDWLGKNGRFSGTGTDDGRICLRNGSVTIDLMGFDIDRNMDDECDSGQVFRLRGGSLTIKDSVGSGCITGALNEGNGGAFYMDGSSTLTIESGNIAYNRCDESGSAVFATGKATVNLTGGSLYSNRCDDVSWGGGGDGCICIEDKATLNMSGGSIRDNYSYYCGGGIALRDSGACYITGGSITGNKAAYGAGIYNDSDGRCLIANVRVSDNIARTEGGGVQIYTSTDPYIGGSVYIFDNIMHNPETGEGPYADNLLIYDEDTNLNHAMGQKNDVPTIPLCQGAKIGMAGFSSKWFPPDDDYFSANDSLFEADSVTYFYSDDPNYVIRCKENPGSLTHPYKLYITRLHKDYLDVFVSFEANGGSGSMSDAGMVEYSSYRLPECGFTPPADCVFSHWQTAEGDNYNVDDSMTVTESLSVKAIWKYSAPQGPVFTALSYDSGCLSNVSTAMEYSLNNGSTWQPIDSDNFVLQSLVPGSILLRYCGSNGILASDSLELSISRTDTPEKLSSANCSSAGNDGRIINTDSSMEYRIDSAEDWTAVSGTEISYLAPGIYHVRTKAAGSALASDHVTLNIYEPQELSGLLKINGDAVYGNLLTVTITDSNAQRFSCLWKRDGVTVKTGSFYTPGPEDIGRTIYCEASAEGYSGIISAFTGPVEKAGQAAPESLSVNAPSVFGSEDGSISGVSELMEYKKSGESEWTRVSGTEISGLSAGDYLVRLAETATHKAGAVAEITVPEGPVPNLIGLEISSPPVKTVYIPGEEFDPEGMVVTALYDVGGNRVLSEEEYSISPEGALEESTDSITLSYGGVSCSLSIEMHIHELGYQNMGEQGHRLWCLLIACPDRESSCTPIEPHVYDSDSDGLCDCLYSRPMAELSFYTLSGSGSMEKQVIAQGIEYSLPECSFSAPENAEFECWRINGSDYAAGESFSISAASFSVQAIWKYKAPENALFTAADNHSGTLSGLEAGMKYSTDDGLSWLSAAADSAALSGLSEGSILVMRPGNGSDILPSDPATVAVGRALPPQGLTKTDCSSAGNDGSISGVDSSMEYRLSSADSWSSISGTEISGLAPGSYYVRVKAAENTLASGYVTLSIIPFNAQPMGGSLSLSGSAVYGETLSAVVSDCAAAQLSYLWLRGEDPIPGAVGSSYTLTAEDIGSMIYCQISPADSLNYNGLLSAALGPVEKAEQAAPESLSANAPSVSGSEDGSISGVSALMEYKKSGESEWTRVSGTEISGLSAGDYLVRLAENATHKAGAELKVTVPEGPVPNLIGLEISSPPAKTVYIPGEEFDPEGMVVTALYDVGGNRVLSDDEYSISPEGALEESTDSITVSYMDMIIHVPIRIHIHEYAYRYDQSGHWQICTSPLCPSSDFGISSTLPHSFDDDFDCDCICTYQRSMVTLSFTSYSGSGLMNPVSIAQGGSCSLPECSFSAPANAEFECWRINGSDYAAGDTFGISGSTDALAMWRYSAPLSIGFSAADDSSGTLSGLSYGMQYSSDNGLSWTAAAGESAVISGLSAGSILVMRSGNGSDILPSEAVSVSIGKAEPPAGLGKINCSANDKNDGKITGVDETMEYRAAESVSRSAGWTAVEGGEISGLAPGSYYVRVKAQGSILASNYVVMNIARPQALTGSLSLEGRAVCGEELRAVLSDCSADESLLRYSWRRGDKLIEGAENSCYTLTAEDIGMSIHCEVSAEGYNGLLSDSAGPVEKADAPAAPEGLEANAPSLKGKDDGSISGVDSGIEYRKKGQEQWTKAEGSEIIGLEAGEYELRYAETDSCKAGDSVLVTVPEGASPVLTGLEIVTPPTKTVYMAGEEFDPEGMVLKAVYSPDGSIELLPEDCIISPQRALETGDESINFSYSHYGSTATATLDIIVHQHLLRWCYTDGSGHWQECADPDCPAGDKGRTEKHAHSMSNWKTTLRPSPSSDGRQERSCLDCGYTEVQSLRYNQAPVSGDSSRLLLWSSLLLLSLMGMGAVIIFAGKCRGKKSEKH